MRKQLAALSIMIIFVLSNIVAALASEGEGEEMRTIVVGLYEEEGFTYVTDEDTVNSIEGYAVEYLNQLGVDCEYRIEFHIAEKGMLLEDLISGKCDIILTCSNGKEEYADYIRSENSVAVEHCILYTKYDADICYEETDKFDGMNIGICRNSEFEEELKSYADQHGFTYSLTYFDDNDQLLEAVEKQTVDAGLLGSLVFVDENVKNIGTFGSYYYYLMGKADMSEVISEMDNTIGRLEIENATYIIDLYSDIYWDSRGNYPALSREEKEYIESHPDIRVGYYKDMHPIQCTDEGEFSGIARGFFDFCTTYTGMSFEFVEYSDTEKCMMDLISGEIDVIALIPYYRDWAVSNNMLVSKQYLKIPLYEVTARDNAARTKVGVSSYFIYGRYSENLEGYSFKNYDNVKKCLDAVKYGEVDVTYVNEYSWMTYCDKAAYSNLVGIRTENRYVHFSAAAKMDDDGSQLIGLINKCIDAMPNELLSKITVSEIYFSGDLGKTFERFIIEYKYHMIFGLIVLVVSVIGAVTHNKRKKEDMLRVLAYTDPVTGGANYAKFLLDAQDKLRYKDCKYAVGYLNIDNFKYINDFYGREQGDNVLIKLSHMLEDIVQPDGIFARVSADRFVFLVSYIDYPTLKFSVDTYLSSVEMNISGFSDTVTLRCNCGIYLVNCDEENVQDMIDRAAIAEKMARESRSESVVQYDNAINDVFMKNQEMTAYMKNALLNEEFVVYLQPKVNTLTGVPAGCEALIRWFSPSKGFIPVSDFVPLFEKNGFITDVDFYVLERVCRLIRKRLDAGLPVFPVNVNQSRLHVDDKTYLSLLEDMLNKYDIPMKLVIFEITESAFIEDPHVMIELINRMKYLGFQFSMDDFGSGYSSFNLLKDMPVDELKIDKEFLESTSDSERSRYIIEQIVHMAHGLNIKVVCEGVETKEQVEFLREINCDIIQGYYFAKPMPMDQFEEYLLQYDFGNA